MITWVINILIGYNKKFKILKLFFTWWKFLLLLCLVHFHLQIRRIQNSESDCTWMWIKARKCEFWKYHLSLWESLYTVIGIAWETITCTKHGSIASYKTVFKKWMWRIEREALRERWGLNSVCRVPRENLWCLWWLNREEIPYVL